MAPATPGIYDYAYRFQLTGESDWVVCDRDGSTNDYSADQAGELTVAVPEIDWARVMVPAETATVIPGQVIAGQVRVYEAGVTDAVGPGGILVELGIGDDGTDPATDDSWAFFPAGYEGFLL